MLLPYQRGQEEWAVIKLKRETHGRIVPRVVAPSDAHAIGVVAWMARG